MAFYTGTDGSDRIGGTSGKDSISGGKGVDYMYGGAGNDAFVIQLKDMDASLNNANSLGGKVQDVIYDFYGAGGYEGGGNNDFLYLKGFGEGSTISFIGYGQNSDHPDGDPTAQFYSIYSTTTGLDYVIAIGSMNGKQLILGDYNFYA